MCMCTVFVYGLKDFPFWVVGKVYNRAIAVEMSGRMDIHTDTQRRHGT